jgi:hypothetical protein
METGLKLSAKTNSSLEKKSIHRKPVGSLTNHKETRPNLSFAISYISSSMTALNAEHWTTDKRILTRYNRF